MMMYEAIKSENAKILLLSHENRIERRKITSISSLLTIKLIMSGPRSGDNNT